MSRDQSAEVSIQKMYGDKSEQGREIARLNVSTYKHTGANAMRVFVREVRPRPGRYLASWTDRGEGHSLLFEVKYADAVVISNGSEELLGGDFGWNRGSGTVLALDERIKRDAA